MGKGSWHRTRNNRRMGNDQLQKGAGKIARILPIAAGKKNPNYWLALRNQMAQMVDKKVEGVRIELLKDPTIPESERKRLAAMTILQFRVDRLAYYKQKMIE